MRRILFVFFLSRDGRKIRRITEGVRKCAIIYRINPWSFFFGECFEMGILGVEWEIGVSEKVFVISNW